MKRLRRFLILTLASLTFNTASNAQWVQTNGPSGGIIRHVAVFQSDLYISGSGLLRSTNSGATWNGEVNGLPEKGTIHQLVSTNTHLFVGLSANGSQAGGVYRFAKGGSDWTLLPLNVNNITAMVASGPTVLVCSENYQGDTLFVSSDTGKTWTKVQSGQAPPNTVYSFAFSGTTIYAGTYPGVFFSTTGGLTWNRRSGIVATSEVYALAVLGTDLFAGTSNEGVHKLTVDGWSQANNGLPDHVGIQTLAVAGSDIFAGTRGYGVYRSTDAGTSWSAANTGIMPHSNISSIAAEGLNLFAAGSNAGVYTSTDAGLTWSMIGPHLEPNTDVLSLAFQGGKLFAGTQQYDGIYISSDDGNSWVPFNAGVMWPRWGIVVAASSTSLHATNGSWPIYSTDAGEHWSNGVGGLPQEPSACCFAFKGTDIFMNVWPEGIYRSTDDGANWNFSGALGSEVVVYAQLVVGNDLLVGTSHYGIYRSADDGVSWGQVNSGLPPEPSAYRFAMNGDYIFAGLLSDGVYRSSDNGMTWEPANAGLPVDEPIRSLECAGTALFASVGDTSGVMISVDNGTSWNKFNSGLPERKLVWDLLHVGSRLYAGLDRTGVWYSSISNMHACDVHEGWNLVSVPATVPDNRATSIFPTGLSAAIAFDGTLLPQENLSTGIGYWMKFGEPSAIPIAGDSVSIDTIDVSVGWNLIGSISSVVQTADIASNPSGMITSEFFGYDGGYYHAPTIEPGKGYWVKCAEAGTLILSAQPSRSLQNRIRIVAGNDRPPDPPGGREKITEAPVRFGLEQNYPNPFNPVTAIRYALSADGYTTLKVYDILGREVATLVDEVMLSGTHTIIWDATGMPSGVYFCRVFSGGMRLTQKLVLAR